MIRVLLVDDHPVVRRGLRQILTEHGDVQIIGEAGDGAEALELARAHACDVAVLDLALPGRGGLELLRLLKAEHPGIKVLLLSVHPEEQFGVRALRTGADGYLSKDRAPHDLVAAIRRLAAGGRYVTPQVAEQLAARAASPGPPHEQLSARELEVLRLLASGLTVGEIGDRQRLSVKTVSTYRARILEKLHVRNNVEIARYAVDHHLVE